MKPISLGIFIFLFVFHSLSSQDLRLNSGKAHRIIKTGTFIRLDLPHDARPCKKCEYNSITGKLLSTQRDSISLLVHSSLHTETEGGQTPVLIRKSYKKDQAPILSMAKADILSITKKGRKRVGDRTSAEKIGMLFFVWGGAHIAIAPALDDADQSNTLIGIGLTEMVLGVAMARIFRQKPTITSQECPLMKAGKRLWAIE